MNNKIYRFAPSPTGFLHIGGARTAIFNWLLAKKEKGKLLLRIEDTDRNRSSTEYIEQIFSSLEWLGMDCDDKPIYQSKNEQRHIEIANLLVKNKKAYQCFCTHEILKEKRLIAEKNKSEYIYDGTCRKLSTNKIDENLKNGIKYSIRLKTEKGNTKFDDLVMGEISLNTKEFGDFILVRSNGTPVYQLAVVVDDHDMGVTDIVRGADHLSNTPKQKLIYEALKWDIPKFAHLPLILGPDKKRLSKRHGSTSVEEFKTNGILPEAMFNYLCLLGWSSGDDQEKINKNELMNLFSIKSINNTNAIFDEQKLLWINGKYISESDGEFLLSKTQTFQKQKNNLSESQKKSLIDLSNLVKIRARSLIEFENGMEFFYQAPQTYDEKGIKKYFTTDTANSLLNNSKEVLENINDFTPEGIEICIRNLAEDKGVSAAKVIHPLRLALTGKIASPGIFEIIQILGKKESIYRIECAIKFINKESFV